MWDEITYPFPSFNGWISNFIPHFARHMFTYPCCDKYICSIYTSTLLTLAHVTEDFFTCWNVVFILISFLVIRWLWIMPHATKCRYHVMCKILQWSLYFGWNKTNKTKFPSHLYLDVYLHWYNVLHVVVWQQWIIQLYGLICGRSWDNVTYLNLYHYCFCCITSECEATKVTFVDT